MAIRNDQIFELLQSMCKDLSAVKVLISNIDGRLSAVEVCTSKLPQHSKDITILKERVGTHKMNWNRVINIMLAVGQAILILWLVSKLAL